MYEILEPNCIIRRIEYQADHRHGFQILGITQRSCQEVEKRKFHPTVATSGFIPPPPSPKTTPKGKTIYNYHMYCPTVAYLSEIGWYKSVLSGQIIPSQLGQMAYLSH